MERPTKGHRIRRPLRTSQTECDSPGKLRRPVQRVGAAATELAICLPVLVLIVFGSIQACNLIFLKHALTAAAYEGTLELSKPNATNASVLARAQQVLDARNVAGATLAILPAGTDINAAAPGTQLTISATAPTASNLMLSGFVFSPPSLSSNLVATR